MIRVGGVIYRKAEERDVFPLMKLFQLSQNSTQKDSLFLDHVKLRAALLQTDCSWIVGEKDNQLLACFSILLDKEDRLAKMNRFFLDPTWEDWSQLLKDALPLLLQYLTDEKRRIEVIYTTSRTFTMPQQEMMLNMGFKILGILPVSGGVDDSQINGLTAYFCDGVLKERRYREFSLHPIVVPFYELVRKECGLETLPVAEKPQMKTLEFEELPSLELIYAPNFVSEKFRKMRERKSLAIHFYPFTQPNTLITDAHEKVEIYVKIMEDSRMATIIGERLDMSINPTELYSKVSHMLNARNINYIEVISDAADVWGVEAITMAGYLPCAYFPCLKDQGEVRRDYVVLARSFERPFAEASTPFEVHHTFLDFFKEYYQLEARSYLRNLTSHS